MNSSGLRCASVFTSQAFAAQQLPQVSERVKNVRLDGADRAAERLRDFLMRHLVIHPQDQRRPLFAWQPRYRRPVYQLCYRFVGNHEDASDLSQDVFLRAFRGLRNFKGESSLGTWLYRIGVNVCLNRVSAKPPVNEPIDKHQYLDDRSESPRDLVLRGERAMQVRAAIARLPRKQRAALILRMYHEMSHQEIAETLGSSVGAVKANVFHALQNLKKLLVNGVS